MHTDEPELYIHFWLACQLCSYWYLKKYINNISSIMHVIIL